MDKIFSKKYTKLRILILVVLLCLSSIMILNTYFLTVRQQSIVDILYANATTEEQKYQKVLDDCKENAYKDGVVYIQNPCRDALIDKMFEKKYGYKYSR